MGIIRAINKCTNPKVENLPKGDKTYNDPARGTKGELFEIQVDNIYYNFRRHNSKKLRNGKLINRFRLTAKYPKGQKQSLPFGIVVYLGLSRIVPIGELEDCAKKINKKLPEKY